MSKTMGNENGWLVKNNLGVTVKDPMDTLRTPNNAKTQSFTFDLDKKRRKTIGNETMNKD